MISNTFIVEDQENQYNAIVELLEMEPFAQQIKIVSTYLGRQPYDEAKQEILRLKPSLLFIDHDLQEGKGKTGLHLFKEVEDEHMFVIFFSQVEEAINNPNEILHSRFIGKNVEEEINSQYRRVIVEKEKGNIIDIVLLEKILKLAQRHFKNYIQAVKIPLRFSNSSGTVIKNIPIGKIICMEGDKQYSHLYMTGESKRTIHHTLKNVWDEFNLEAKGFVRCHKSWVINLETVSAFSTRGIELIGLEKIIPLGRKFKEEALSILKGIQ